MSRKGGSRARGGWVHPKGEDSMVMSVEVVEDKWRESTRPWQIMLKIQVIMLRSYYHM